MFCLRLEWLFSRPLQIHLQLYLVSIVLDGLVAGQCHVFEVGALHYTREMFIFFICHLICHADISHAKHAMIKDLRHRGEKNVLVTREQAGAVHRDVAGEYSTVETMHPCIVKYCNVYAKDLAEHLALNERNLPDALATPVRRYSGLVWTCIMHE